jgi:hypothetical protein
MRSKASENQSYLGNKRERVSIFDGIGFPVAHIILFLSFVLSVYNPIINTLQT